MADDKTKVILDLDNKEFVKKMKESIGLMGEMGEAEGLSSVIDMFLKVGKVAAIAAAAIVAVKIAIDLTKEGEQVKQIENSFEALAKSAGLAGTELKDKLISAVHGLADDTDILLAANKAIITMGESADKLPEIMDLARKYTAGFGGDLIQNFEGMTTAVVNVNTKMLRQYGITIDSDAALKKYAQSLGTTAEVLNDAGRKQAILNEFLDQAEKKYKGIDENSTPVTDSITRLTVAFKHLKEQLAVFTEKSGVVNSALSMATDAFDIISQRIKENYGTSIEKAAGNTRRLNEEIEALVVATRRQKKELDQGPTFMEKWFGDPDQLKFQYDQNVKRLADLDEQLKVQNKNLQNQRDIQNAIEEEARKRGSGAAVPGADPRIAHEDQEKIKTGRLKFNEDLLNMQRENIAAHQQIAASDADLDANRAERAHMMELDLEQKKMILKKQYLDTGFINKQQFNDAIMELEQANSAKLIELDQNADAERLQAMERYRNAATSTYDGIARSAEIRGAQATKANEDFGKKGAKVMDIFESHAANAFMELGEGTKDAGDVMKGFFFGALAEMAEMQGRIYLGMGIGGNYLAAAAGAGLLILAGVLRGMSKGSAKSSGGGGEITGGGGGAVGGGLTSPETSKPEIEEQKRKAVTVAIHGNYFETEQTRTRLMEMIREAGDFTDFNLKQIGQS